MAFPKIELNKRLASFLLPKQGEIKPAHVAEFDRIGGTYNYLFAIYNGEKNLGEIGPIKNYVIDYNALRMRSWQAYHESEIVQTILNRYNTWVVGSGLKLQVEPEKTILKSEGIEINLQEFSKVVEARFAVFANGRESDFSENENINRLAATAWKNALLGGDVLVINRYTNTGVNTQLVDGAHIQSPAYGTEWYPQKLENGNVLINGIEMTPNGKHVRYYIRQKDFSFQIVEAYGKKTGLRMAYMVYGLRYRIDHARGIPLFAVVLETLKKLERYKEAAVGSAEERQKIIMQVVHKEFSTGENPQQSVIAKAHNYVPDTNQQIPTDINGKELANTIAVSTNKQTYNMPVGSELKSIESKNELYFKEFYDVNFNIICAAIGIPPNVASSLYNDSFSASRAALKDWEHTLKVRRKDFAFQFYQPIYDLWFETQILEGKIQAPGYLTAKQQQNIMVLNAYKTARFVGTPVPHIDPVTEVNAERLKLGVTGAALPLTTLEAATEALNGGESIHNMDQYAEELKKSKDLGIEIELPENPDSEKQKDD